MLPNDANEFSDFLGMLRFITVCTRNVDSKNLVDLAGTTAQKHYSIGQHHGLLNIVGNIKGGEACLFPQGDKFLLHDGAGLGIQCTEGLVH